MKGKSAMASSSRRSAGSSTPSPSRQSHQSSSRKSGRKSGLATSAIFGEDDEDLSDLDDAEDALFNSRPIRSNASRSGARSNSRSGSNAPTSSNNVHSPKRKPERKKEERKASVRKEMYDLDGTDSELSDAPEENSSNAKSHHESDDPNLTDSDDDMAERLRAAGDGESLLGSAISDREGGDTDQEEERFIIEDARRLQAKADARRQRDGSTPQRAEKSVSPSIQKRRSQQDDDPFPDNASGSLSPQTLQQLGLDELFGEADGFHSSSEPSFTDFFMSDSEVGTDDDDLELEARSDDDQLTTDNDDESDISDMEDGLLSAPFLSEALAAGAGTQLMPHNPDAIAQADIPLLVIEDLDGRLIYARAGDGEAVFGSDGEFEFVDDSEEESEEDDIHFPMDGFNGTRWTNWRNDDGDETDEGETTDELPNEDMPFPRLLVGSVAPRGGRNARRARALAARSRRISPARARGHSRELSATKDMIENIEQNANINENVKEQGVTETKNGNSAALQDVDFSISTEDLARDPQATLEAAAKSLGLTVDEVAQLVIGSAASTSNNADVNGQASGIPNAAYLSPEMNNVPLPIPVTPDHQRYQAFRRAPLMGSFMPTSSKGIHRAVIDGSNQAPSPFANRFGTQRKGLANGKKRQPSQSTPSAKRLRRESAASMALNSEYSENHENSAQPEEGVHEEIDEMDLDDVMDASMMWRGSYSSSPPHGSIEEKANSLGKKSPAMRPSSARKASNAGATATSPEKSTGLNLNAVARWHRIPMGAFRDGQVTASHAGSSSNVLANQQPLGSFLLTRGRGGGQHGGKNGASSRAQAEHSPFRGRTRGDSIHLGQAPKMTTMRDAFIVSPVLWPSNSNGQAVPNVQLGGHYQANQFVQGQNGANDTRKMTTRREKRERKARRAALKSALESAATEDMPDPSAQSPYNQESNAGSALLDSPSTALPRLSITDASPHGSPLASKSKPLPPSGLSKEITGGKVSEFAVPDVAASGKNKASGAIDIPSSSAFSSSPSMTGMTHGSQAGGTNPMSGSMPTTSPSSSLSSHHQPPSSVFGMPLHSPLFGSILNPTNLGFRDDLDERDEEGVLTI